MVAFLGEMGKMDVFEVGVSNFAQELGALLIRKVSLAAEDALFVDHGARGGVDHRRLVVGFDVEVVTLFEMVFNEGGDKAEISAEAEFEVGGADGEGNGIEGIVLDAKRMNFEVSKFKGFSCGKDFKFGGFIEGF